MGTETDQLKILEAMFLQHETAQGIQSYGFHKSKEGRELIRQLFQPFLRRRNIGEGKVASIIADSYANPDYQAREIDRTKSALRRWLKDGQSELWPKDDEKNLRYISRLESEFIAVEEVNEVLLDTAETIQKHRTGITLAQMIYGAIPPLANDPAVEEIQRDFCGFYSERIFVRPPTYNLLKNIEYRAANEFSDLVHRRETASTIELEVSDLLSRVTAGQTIDYDPYVLDEQETRRCYYIAPVRARNFMTIFRFDFYGGFTRRADFRNLRIGYALPTRKGTLHTFFSPNSASTPYAQYSFTPNSRAELLGGGRNQKNLRVWNATSNIFSERTEATQEAESVAVWKKIVPEDAEYPSLRVDKIVAHLEQIRWNMVS